MSESYSNIFVNEESYTILLPHQRKFVKFCIDLNNLKKTCGLTKVSITIDGIYTYNNIEILTGPETSVYDGQNWSIKWVNEDGKEQNMEYTYKKEQSKHTDISIQKKNGGNKKRRRTKGKKIKRKKTKKTN